MTEGGPAAVYTLCAAASVLCAFLVARRFFAARSRLLLMVALGFVALALNNILLVTDMLVLRHVDLWPARQLSAAAAVAVLTYGFIWESDR